MRVLITGRNGQVGKALQALAPQVFEVIALDSNELDISNARAVDTAITRYRPELIINAAAYTSVDKAETEKERVFAANSAGVANLARQQVPLLHISTDYVFPGDATTPYLETDVTGPTGVYGASKLAGEQQLVAINPRHIIVRTAWVFAAHGNNFVKTMLRLGAAQETLHVVHDQQGCPTSAQSIAQMLWQLAIAFKANGQLAWGTYHFAGAPACSWYEFAQTIFFEATKSGLLDKVPTLIPITTSEYATLAQRPAWSVLDCRKMHSTFGIKQPHWKHDLKEVMHTLISNS